MADEGRISQTDLVSEDGGATWIEAGKQPILKRLFAESVEEPQRFTASRGRRINTIAGICFLVVLGWAVWPYYTLYSIAVAVRDTDVSSLESLVNWDGVRQGLRGDFNALLLKKSAAEKDDFGKGLAMVLGPTLINQMVDGYVTPQAFASLMRTGKPPATGVGAASTQSRSPQTPFQSTVTQFDLKQVRYAFFNGGPFSFRVDVQPNNPDAGGVLRLDLKWSGKWQVDRVTLPLDDFEAFQEKRKAATDTPVAFAAPEQSSKTSLPVNRAAPASNVVTWGAMFKAQVERCWKKPSGGVEALTTEAVFSVKLKRDGTLAEAPINVGQSIVTPYARQYRDSALKAIVGCAPYNLPAAYFEEWKYFEPVFTERKS